MRWRTVGQVAAAVFVGLVVPGAVGAAGIAGAIAEIYPARDHSAPPVSVDTAAVPAHDPDRPTAVVVLGLEGANVADALAPYEVLAVTGAFNLYTVAATRQAVPLTGGLDLVPDLTFGQLEDRLPSSPDVIVVPQLHHAGQPILQWLRRQRSQGDPLLVSVCTGAEVLASAGLLDGRPATSHWLGLIGLRRDYPAVRWQDGVRYVDDGDLITTAGVLSGVDGALRVIERMLGPAAAAQAARAVAWPAYSPGGAAAIQRSRPAPADVVALLSAGYRWDRPSTGVLLTDGVGEIELASAFRPYTELSYLARPVAVTADGQPIRSRHGLTFAPRADLTAAASGLDRLLVPGADAARRAAAEGLSLPQRMTPVYLHHQPGFAFDGALRDIARTRDVATARWVAKTLQYPTTNPALSGPAWPWTLTLRPILIAAALIAAVPLGIQLLRRRRSAPAHAAQVPDRTDPGYWPPVDRELVLTLDDLLLEDGGIAPFSRTETSYAAMGRFGNVFLTGGEPDPRLEARAGEVVRLWLTNTASTRVFNLALPGARMKLVGGDGGRVEHHELVDQVLLGPSERAVVDVLVEHPGALVLEHRSPRRTAALATITLIPQRRHPQRRGGRVPGAADRAGAGRRAAGA